LFGLLVLLYFDHRYRAFNFANTDNIDGWLRWTMEQPQIYAAAIPALGFIADVVPVALRTRGAHVLLRTAIAMFSVLTFGAWSFLSFENHKLTHEFLFIAFGFAIIVPLLMFTAGI